MLFNVPEVPEGCLYAGEFQCDNGNCIPRSWRCDNDTDCHDGSDEVGCGGNVTFAEFTGGEIYIVAPGELDSEEVEETNEEVLPEEKCNGRPEFECMSGGCIPHSWVCDGDKDCRDASDEANCVRK